MIKNIIIGLMVAALVVIVVLTALAQSTATVEVRVWQSVDDANSLYISARYAGGSWAALGTIPLDMSGLSASRAYRFGDIAVEVPLPDAPAPTPVPTPTPTPSPTPTSTPISDPCDDQSPPYYCHDIESFEQREREIRTQGGFNRHAECGPYARMRTALQDAGKWPWPHGSIEGIEDAQSRCRHYR